MEKSFMSFILTFILMFIFWVLLSGHFGLILMVSAVVFSLLVAYLSHDLLLGRASLSALVGTSVRFLVYLPWLFWEIAVANFDVIYRTLHPGMLIDPEMVTFDPKLKSDVGITILANSITLTPGTVTVVAVKKGDFKVHSLTKGADMGPMVKKVKWIEGE
ncbi:MAG: Na+/H+ antiporter subunit E [Proteobacteria bacterium]|nr:Na+/H+ antiporter subunit E [Pseudomonadota bacterium]